MAPYPTAVTLDDIQGFAENSISMIVFAVKLSYACIYGILTKIRQNGLVLLAKNAV